MTTLKDLEAAGGVTPRGERRRRHLHAAWTVLSSQEEVDQWQDDLAAFIASTDDPPLELRLAPLPCRPPARHPKQKPRR